jgi:nucleoside 2-deoxyribosyltransferase
MKIYLAIKFHSDNQNRPLIDNLAMHLTRQGHSVVCAVKDFENWGKTAFEPPTLLNMAFEAIEKSDLVLIEATEKGMGVGIEAGFAFARNIPIVTIAKIDSDISVNLKSLSERVIFYSEVTEINL